MKKTIFVNWSFEVAFSVYAALLIGWAEESRPNAWSTSGRYLYFWHPHAPALGQSDFVLFYLELLLGLTAVVFVSLKLIELLSRRSAVLLTGGVLSIAGIPLVLLYSARGHSLPILIELVIASVCTVLWMCRKWPVSTFFTCSAHITFCVLLRVRVDVWVYQNATRFNKYDPEHMVLDSCPRMLLCSPLGKPV